MQVEGITKTKDLVVEVFESTVINSIAKIPIIALYKNPSDYPGHYVARLFDKEKPMKFILLKNSLEELRKAIPPHMVRINRSSEDDSKIIESYI